MRYICLFFLIIFASTTSVAGSNPELLKLIPQLLAKIPDSSFEVKKGKKDWEVSFCPDNTCDVIRAPISTPENIIGDFSLFYLYYASGYVYLKDFCLRDAKPYIPSVLSRYSSKCPKSSELATAACVMKGLVTQYDIRISFRRSDEGVTGEISRDLDKQLSEANLIKTKEWQIETWKRYP